MSVRNGAAPDSIVEIRDRKLCVLAKEHEASKPTIDKRQDAPWLDCPPMEDQP